MYPVDYGIHGYGAVQAAIVLHVGLTLGVTLAAWWLGVQTEMAGLVFVVTGIVLLHPFWSPYTSLHPEHDDG